MQNNYPSHDMLLAALDRLAIKSAKDQLPPVCIAVSDEKGELLLLQRLPGTPARAVEIATAKAYTSARMGIATSVFKKRLINEQQSLGDFIDRGYTSLPGGIPIKSSGHVVAAVGISGRSPEQDEELAEFFVSILCSSIEVFKG